jgi:hypothetical protein
MSNAATPSVGTGSCGAAAIIRAIIRIIRDNQGIIRDSHHHGIIRDSHHHSLFLTPRVRST